MLALQGESSTASRPTALVSRSTGNIIADYDIPHKSRHTFINYLSLRKFLESAYSQWESNASSQYVAIECVTHNTIEWLDKNRRELPGMRLHYDLPSEKLIIKFVSTGHEIFHNQFSAMLTDHFRNVGITRRHLMSRGAGRDSGNGQRQKEPDNAFKPLDTRRRENDKATLVIEAGMSETLNQLRNDAHFWLTKTDQEVKIVLLIHVRKEDKIITLERWENQTNPRPTRGTSTAHRPTKMQSLTITVRANGTTTVTGAPLTLPITLLFDVIPAGLPTTGLDITAAELRDYAEEAFDGIEV